MPYTLWSQDIFSKGELSPLMYARATVNEYNNGLKTAQNVLTFPTGAAGKRFGTLYQATLNAGLTELNQLYFQTFQYLNECVYQLVFRTSNVDIYLEGILVATVSTGLTAEQTYNMITTVIGPLFRCTGNGFAPFDLSRSTNLTTTISGNATSPWGNVFQFGAGNLPPGLVNPVRFTTTGSLPTTNPQINVGVTYFAYMYSATQAIIFSSAYDAKFDINPFTITNSGTGTNRMVLLNGWTFSHSVFKNLPVYDFNSATVSYDALTFTPSATTGTVTITISGAGYAPLNSTYVGGAFIGNGGSGRITAVASATSFTVSVQNPFDSTTGIIGSLVLLAEPAWSTARGFPQVCSSYQNRALFANTASLPNGFWASVINDYTDFGDLTTDDDDAIAWYPTSDNMNFIRFIVPYRSITVHTNTGIYSSPLSDVAAITPSNFTLQLQDSTPADVLQPTSIDNQIIVLSGNDAQQMLWDGINNAYTSNVISIINEQTIRDPQDETAFQNLRRAGSRFVFITNANGSLAVFQTLLSQGVSGFTPQIMEQSYGNASFIQTASSSDGRCWFIVQRQIGVAGSPVAITGFTAHTPIVQSKLHAVGSSFSTTTPTEIAFTTSGTLPVSSPQVVLTQYYWAVGVDADNFIVYQTQEDALAGVEEIQFTSAGTTSNVVAWNLTTIFTMEELTDKTFLDCAVYFNENLYMNTGPLDTIPTGTLFNGQHVKMVGDGFGFDTTPEKNIANQIVFKAHGELVEVSEAYIGFPINTIMEPMPLNIASGSSAKETTLTQPKRIMFVRFMFNNTIGGTINGVPIALEAFNQADIGEPPHPARGVVEMSIMKGWDDFKNPVFTIEHDDPFDIQLLGVFYSVEI